jgi:hypothetical protein
VSSNGSNGAPASLAGRESPTQSTAMTEEPDDRLERARWLLALGGVVAGLAAFAVGEATYKWIPAQQVTYRAFGRMVTSATGATVMVADARNGALAFAVLGCWLGGCLGIAGGLARRAPAAAAVSGLLGAILGAALAGGVSLALLPILMDAQIVHLNYEIMISIVMHALPWGLAGAAAGLAFTVGLGRRLLGLALMAGFAGAVVGSVAFDLVGAALFPFSDTLAPISTTWASRLMARLLVTVVTAAAVTLSLSAPRRTKAVCQPEIMTSGQP